MQNELVLTTLDFDSLKQAIDETIINELQKLKPEQEPNKTSSPEYLTINEVSKLFKCSLPTIWSWRKKGYLKAYSIGRRIFFKSNEIENSLKNLSELGNKPS